MAKNSVATTNNQENVSAGKGVDGGQTGYMLGDKVLRFAKVVVGE